MSRSLLLPRKQPVKRILSLTRARRNPRCCRSGANAFKEFHEHHEASVPQRRARQSRMNECREEATKCAENQRTSGAKNTGER
eukprot:6213305-Pleurochrysis_carterae.AAC.6